eukprot:TRINITY_DN6918_c0_g1_i1.p1 TRINITY_DN6918_c0_g1~~TRINITY_DN6918_c0_g1_i1.p1  ORF type:complete len:452 (+),score=119.40 TRINITY_DN6918_c0_g1_i1:113-1357(+)
MSNPLIQALDDELKATFVDSGKLSGTVLLVAKGGKVEYLNANGLKNVDRKVEMKTDDVVRIYSMTKPITSVALLTLLDQGKFSLDDDVASIIPEFKHLRVVHDDELKTRVPADAPPADFPPKVNTVDLTHPLTFRHVLTHQSGFTYGFHKTNVIDKAYRDGRVMANPDFSPIDEDLAQSMAKLARVPLLFQPGTGWNYSVSTDVCGYLVEKLSGKTFEEYLQEVIFGPLGMKDTGFKTGEKDRFATLYFHTPAGKVPYKQDEDPLLTEKTPTFLSGGGGLLSTANDYFRFCQMVLNGGSLDGVRILKEETIKLMGQNHLSGGADLEALVMPGIFSESKFAGVGFGLGFAKMLDTEENRGRNAVGNLWWGGLASTFFYIDPSRDVVVVFLTQLVPSSTYPEIRELVMRKVAAAFV